MAERFARQRLRAMAKIEGLRDDGKPTVLFLCVHNAGRSQMALGFFTHLAGDAAVAAMRERGIDIGGEFPKPWTDETVLADVRPIRDDIERRVRVLLDDLQVPVTG